MSQHVLTSEANRRQLQQIIAGLSDGVILLDPDQSILWANEAALAMHGASQISDLGSNAKAYVKRFALRYRNNHLVPADSYPISRVARGETFSDVLVEVTSVGNEARTWVHRVRSLVLVDGRGKPESLVLIMDDVTDRASTGQLTARERDVLGLICEGLADKDIAARLKLAPNTVRNHVATVYSKLNVHSRSEAIVWARERGTVLW
ncbi:HTH-type transcriptional regulator MalT [Pseudomonas fluorescens]|uniref:HTH-type transcriptional regulator MalT n=1 Tax=Pseudomonas fluorescens TaxID=294 RepID=A0A5E6SSP5_PSEFL|nr:HTH-type transcriptional regulator MalT [Pseudomonas fluorescens]VVO62525.1 HTH-type transcriptional regulator MalT [Pseudomonas fluorescens]